MSLIIPLALLMVVALTYFISYRQSRRRMYELADLLPAREEIPLLGNAHQFAGNSADIFNNIMTLCRLANENDGVIRQWLGPYLYIRMTNAEDMEIVLNAALDKDPVYRFMNSWLGDGLINSDVSIWKTHRKLLNPTFNQKILDSFVDIFSQKTLKLTKKLESKVGAGPFDLLKLVMPCTLDIVCETALGVEMNSQENLGNSFMMASIRQMNFISKRMCQVWMHPDWIYKLTPYYRQEKENVKVLHAFTDKAVQKKRQIYKDKRENKDSMPDLIDEEGSILSKRKAFLDHIIELTEESGKWTNKELREEVDTVTVAGNDTSALTSCYVLMQLGYYPEIQQKVMDELNEIFGKSDRPVDKDDLPKMEYLERVVKETLRLVPTIPIVVRKLTKEIKLRNYTLPVDTRCVCAIAGLHRNPEVWGEDVLEFDPDRFLPERSANRKPNSFMPFSLGPRNCIGRRYAMMAIKTFVATVLRKYKVHSEFNHENTKLRYEISLKPVGGFLVSLERREE